MADHDELADALEAAGLLQDEYPDQMAQRSCICTSDAVCGAHRLLARYDQLFKAFQVSNREKREAKAALRAALAAHPQPDLFAFKGTWHVRHADGTTEDIVLEHGNLVEDSRGTCGQFILAAAGSATPTGDDDE